MGWLGGWDTWRVKGKRWFEALKSHLVEDTSGSFF